MKGKILRDKGIKISVLDIRDYHLVARAALDQASPDVIVHLAAVTHANDQIKILSRHSITLALELLENVLDASDQLNLI